MSHQFDVRIIEQSADGRRYRAEVTPVQNIAPAVAILSIFFVFVALNKLSESLGITLEQAASLVVAVVAVLGLGVIALVWRFGPAIRRFLEGD